MEGSRSWPLSRAVGNRQVSLPAGRSHQDPGVTDPQVSPHACPLPRHRPGPAGAQVTMALLLAAGLERQPRGRWTLGSCAALHTKFNQQPAPGPPPDLKTPAHQPLCWEKGGPWEQGPPHRCPAGGGVGQGRVAGSSNPSSPAPAGMQSRGHGQVPTVPSVLPLETPKGSPHPGTLCPASSEPVPCTHPRRKLAARHRIRAARQ